VCKGLPKSEKLVINFFFFFCQHQTLFSLKCKQGLHFKMSRCHLALKCRQNSWTCLIQTQLFWIPCYFEFPVTSNSPLFQIPCYFELKTIFLGFALQSFAISYFENLRVQLYEHWLCIKERYKLYPNITNHWSMQSLSNWWVINESNSFCSHTPTDCWCTKSKQNVLTADTMPFLTSHPIFLNPPVDKASFITIPSEFSINLIMKESLLNEKI